MCTRNPLVTDKLHRMVFSAVNRVETLDWCPGNMVPFCKQKDGGK